MANRTSRTAQKDRAFFKALSEYANVSAACKKAKYTRSVVYAAREKDQKFYDKWEAAWSKGIDAMEEEATRRAVQGVEQPVYQGGKLVGKVQKHSDVLLMFMLKGRRPKKFREHQVHEHQGAGGGPPLFQVTLVKPKADT